MLAIPPTPGWNWGPGREENQSGGSISLWGSLWTPSQPGAPAILKNSLLAREESLCPAPLQRFSDLGGVLQMLLSSPKPRAKGGGVPIALQ